MKSILLGLNNPHSDDPARALGTEPKNASGYRLWQMVATSGMAQEPPVVITAEKYEAGFDRRNLMSGRAFDPAVIKDLKTEILDGLADRVVVMCGTNVPRALGLTHNGFDLKPMEAPWFEYYVIPHPSGLTREYNDPGMRWRVGNLLLILYKLGEPTCP